MNSQLMHHLESGTTIIVFGNTGAEASMQADLVRKIVRELGLT